MGPIRSFSSAWGFLTLLGRAGIPDARTFAWFPVVGALLGGLVATTWWGTNILWSPLVAAGMVVAVDLALTGLLHVDGLADSADGLLPHLERDRRLEVMRRTEVGSFALGLVPLTLGLRWAGLATAPIEPLTLIALWTASRTLAALVPKLVPYARAEGLASAFLGPDATSGWLITPWFAVSIAIGWMSADVRGVLALAVLVVFGAAVVSLARRRIGGFTGDVLGATILIGETAGLLTLAIV